MVRRRHDQICGGKLITEKKTVASSICDETTINGELIFF